MAKSVERNNPIIPPDMIFEILIRLPVKSLCRFKCVSADWCSAISNPSFADSYFAYSSTRPKLLICVQEEDIRSAHDVVGKLLLSTEYARGLEHQAQTVAFHGLIPSTTLSHSQSILGLICIKGADGGVQICNPSTRERVSLGTPWRNIQCPKVYWTEVCFGFDPVMNKHKIMHWSKGAGTSEPEPYVLTLGEKRWRRINFDGPNFVFAGPSLYIDGVVYRSVLDAEDWVCRLMAFDVCQETIRMIPCPDEDELQFYKLAMEYRGCPTFIFHFGTQIIVWTLAGLERPVWSCEIHNVSQELKDALNTRSLHAIGITPAGELILSPIMNWEPYHLYFQNQKDGSVRAVELHGLRKQIEDGLLPTDP